MAPISKRHAEAIAESNRARAPHLREVRSSAAWGRALDVYLAEVEARSHSAAAVKTRSQTAMKLLREVDDPGAATIEQLEEWAWRPTKSGPASPSTIKNRLATMMGLFRVAKRLGIVSENPVAEMPRPRQAPLVPRGLDQAEMRKLLAAIPQTTVNRVRQQRTRALLVTLLLSALRRAEILALTPGAFTPRGDRLFYVLRVKGGKERHHEFPHAAYQEIIRWYEVRNLSIDLVPRDQPIFPISGALLLHDLRRLGEAAGIAGHLNIHRCRHAATWLAEDAQMDDQAIADLLGHENPAYCRTYRKRLRGGLDPSAPKRAELLGISGAAAPTPGPLDLNSNPEYHTCMEDVMPIAVPPKKGRAIDGAKVAKLREARGWREVDLASKSGLSLSTILRLEEGRGGGSIPTADILAATFGVKLEALLS